MVIIKRRGLKLCKAKIFFLVLWKGMSDLSDYNYYKTVWGQWPAGALAVRAQRLFLFYMVEEHAVDKHFAMDDCHRIRSVQNCGFIKLNPGS